MKTKSKAVTKSVQKSTKKISKDSKKAKKEDSTNGGKAKVVIKDVVVAGVKDSSKKKTVKAKKKEQKKTKTTQVNPQNNNISTSPPAVNKKDEEKKTGKKKAKKEAEKKVNGVSKQDKNTNSLNDKKTNKTPALKDEESEEETTNQVKALSKGGAVVDPLLANGTNYSVVADINSEHNGKFFSATLNYSDVKNNNNKFYLIQLLREDKSNKYFLFTRWGRVGVPGSQALQPVHSFEHGKHSFISKFQEKTGKGYDEVIIDYSNEEKKEKKVTNKKDEKTTKAAYTLHKKVQELMELIYNTNMMKQQMMEIGYDANKMPLGKLGKETLTQGYEILKEIEKVLDGKKKGDLYELSSNFYSKIPHNFGFQKMSNFVIRDKATLKSKVDLIESLSEIEIATKILEEMEEVQDPYESYYKKLFCDIKHIPSDHSFYSTLCTYLENTSSDNSYQRLELLEAYEINKHGETEKFNDLGNKKLLWHGSRITNYVGILSQGLRIAPPEAPHSGYAFGKGIYFADMASKSACYCSPSKNIGLILLCEVALGQPNELLTSDSNAANLPKGKHSTKGCGVTVPDCEIDHENIKIPLGKPTKSGLKTYLGYNEYIVYNTNQVKIRYLLKIRFGSRK